MKNSTMHDGRVTRLPRPKYWEARINESARLLG